MSDEHKDIDRETLATSARFLSWGYTALPNIGFIQVNCLLKRISTSHYLSLHHNFQSKSNSHTMILDNENSCSVTFIPLVKPSVIITLFHEGIIYLSTTIV